MLAVARGLAHRTLPDPLRLQIQSHRPAPDRAGRRVAPARAHAGRCAARGWLRHRADWQVAPRRDALLTGRNPWQLEAAANHICYFPPKFKTFFEALDEHGWFVKKNKTDLVETDGFQQSALEYPGLSKEEIFESIERFYHRYYLRP